MQVDEEVLEHAYYANSYPAESSKVKCTVNCIKAVAIVALVVEGVSFMRLASNVITYHERIQLANNQIGGTMKVLTPDSVQMSSLAFLVNIVLKAIAAVASFSHASQRTNRTVEKTNSHKAFATKIVIAVAILTATLYYMLGVFQSHQYATYSAHSTTVCESIDNLKALLIF